MKISLGDLAQKLGATLKGNTDTIVTGVADIASAREGQITFAENTRYISLLKKCNASAVIVPQDAGEIAMSALYVDNPRVAFAKVLEMCHPPQQYKSGIHPSAVIEDGAKISSEAYIGPCVVVGRNASVEAGAIIQAGVFIGVDSHVGRNSILHPNVSVMHDVNIGQSCVIHSGTVLGSDGYGFVSVQGVHHKIPQVGTVEIDDNVEIGSNVTVDRATIGATRIGKGTKIDNLVHIAHNVVIGENCLIIAQVGISGSVTLGNNVILAGQVGVVGHLTIGSNSTVAARAVVTGNLPADSMVSGFPAKPHKEEMKIKAALRRLPRLLKFVQLRKCVADDGLPVVEDASENGEDEV